MSEEPIPLTWPQLKQILQTGDLDKLIRGTVERDKYRAFRVSLLRDWNSLADYVRYSKFQWLVAFNEQGKKIATRPPPALIRRISPWLSCWSAVALGACFLGLHQIAAATTFRSLCAVAASVGLCSRLRPIPSLALLPNDFPYRFEPGVLHYLLWKLDGFLTLDEIAGAQRMLLAQDGGLTDSAFWVNPPTLRSIPEIDHAHILVFGRKIYD